MSEYLLHQSITNNQVRSFALFLQETCMKNTLFEFLEHQTHLYACPPLIHTINKNLLSLLQAMEITHNMKEYKHKTTPFKF